METKVKKMKWRTLYKENVNRRYNEINQIVNENATLHSNPIKRIKENKFVYLTVTLIVLAILAFAFWGTSISIFFIVIAFFAVMFGLILYFDSYKMICTKDGLYVKFGFQETMLPYGILKNAYIDKKNDYTFGVPLRDYNITLRYSDALGFLKELTFPTYFLKIEETKKFLENFIIDNKNSEDSVQYEKGKILKNILRGLLFIGFVVFILVCCFCK